MTKEEFLAAVRQYGAYRASDLADDAARKLDEITKAVDVHWFTSAAQWHREHGAHSPKIGTCTRPPKGWFCTKDDGHTGPCPTWPSADAEQFQVVGTRPATMPDLTSAYVSPLDVRRPIGEPVPAFNNSADRCRGEHNPGTWPYTARCIRDKGHEKPMAAGPAKWTPGVEAQDATLRMLGPDEHMDAEGRIWK